MSSIVINNALQVAKHTFFFLTGLENRTIRFLSQQNSSSENLNLLIFQQKKKKNEKLHCHSDNVRINANFEKTLIRNCSSFYPWQLQVKIMTIAVAVFRMGCKM